MATTQRLLTLDIFRGLTIAGMILVNNPGSWSHIYAPLKHADWHGCTPTDLIFPFFLIIVGIAISLSFLKLQSKPSRIKSMKILRRSILIFIIGLLLHAFPFYDIDYSQFRIMGVLQRIAITYALAALIICSIKQKYILHTTVAILMIYWFLFILLGGETPYSANGNIVQKIDLLILGASHMYQGLSIPFDPEGLLSTLPAIATVLIGYQMGLMIINTDNKLTLVKLYLLYGIIGIGVGLLWGQLFPINKALWTSSYVIYTAGWAAILIGLLIWLVDIKGFKTWSFAAVVYGVNPLFLYILAWMLSVTFSRLITIGPNQDNSITLQEWVFENLLVPIAGPLNGSFFYALLFVFMIWLAGLVLYKKQIFIKI